MAHAPLVIVGPSGSGKTYLVERLAKLYPVQLVLSSMTRQPRAGEQNLVDNEFLTDQQFDQAIESGDFFMINHFLGQRYGYRRSFIQAIQGQGGVPAAIVFAPTVEQFLVTYPESFVVFLLPESLEFLAERMRRRGDSEAEITKRLVSAEAEIATCRQLAYHFGCTVRIASDVDVIQAITAIAAHYHLG